MVEYAVLDRAERTYHRPRGFSDGDLTGVGTGSTHSDAIAAALFVVSAYLLLIAQDIALFTLSFLAFAFFYNPVRVRLGGRVATDTGSIFGIV